ncbi:FKBP-type peptidyl-prolyl cis-trans isomerase [Mucilaginibacter sp. X5P1]|uniref:FKBP-type peptidyl-prolyl cis-trans isomerase n=1 Tax=Mucilaginibacter sp. X5P1 TaxID=2723088 RepID=UPI0016099094|nr:FKBP-type peptidyl-prolyl cis-trans isomerase [Mucilaginibacter sp. X5P1]MBB6141291.1 FKBP-type peptidyl-prolyl cis-trans isomerase FkpA [Mucilaginibacter sp. X5P1]
MACQKSTGFGSTQYKAQAAIDDAILTEYIKDNNLTAVAKKVNDTSGVYYIVIDPGSGTTLFTNSTQVTVGDTGRTITKGQIGSGKLFYQTQQYHPTYPLGSVILGWQFGIPMVLTGGEVELLIPSRYAYGPVAHPELNQYDLNPGGLPANSILDFRIRLYDVIN